jgi:hypothetical protein
VLARVQTFQHNNSPEDTDMILKQVLHLQCKWTNLPLIDVNQLVVSVDINDKHEESSSSSNELNFIADDAITSRSRNMWKDKRRIETTIALAYARKRAMFTLWMFESVAVDLNQCDEVVALYFYIIIFVYPFTPCPLV